MNDSESAQDRAWTTEQIATAGAGRQGRTSSGRHPLPDAQTQQPAPAHGSDPGVGDHPHAQLLEDDELQSILVRWKARK
jgi:hypothetical protein